MTETSGSDDDDDGELGGGEEAGGGGGGGVGRRVLPPWADSPSDFVLLVGEGNFSFARALARRFGGLGTRIVATSYDTREQVLAKYPDATEILEELNTAGVTVVHGVDATQLETNLYLEVLG